MAGQRVIIFGNQAFSLVNFRGALMEDLRRRGHEVLALAPDFDDSLRERLAASGIEAVSLSLSRTSVNPLKDLRDLAQLWRIMRDLKPDVVLAFTIKPVVYGTLAATLAGVTRRHVLITGLGYAFSASSSLRDRFVQGLARTLYRVSLLAAHVVFMQNRDDVNEFVARRIVARDKITLVNGTGVDLKEWPVVALPDTPVVFALAARLLGEKGIREYVAAARRVKAIHPETRFLLLGGLDTNPAAISLEEVKGWVEDGIVEWPGHVEMREWLERTSVYVLPSYREGVPRSTQEAMASGRPIITTDVPGCRETVIDGENGFLVPPRDVDALVRAMVHFLENPQDIAVKGHRSRQIAEERFDVHQINARMFSAMGL